MFRKEYINKIGNYRNYFKYAQDYDLWLRISENYEMSNIPEYLYQWRLVFDSASFKNKAEQEYYANLAVTMSKERESNGKDSIDGLTEANHNSIELSYNLNNYRITRKDLSKSYLYWGRRILFKGTKSSESLPWFLKSIYFYPLDTTAYHLMFISLIYNLLPDKLVEMLKKTKRHLYND